MFGDREENIKISKNAVLKIPDRRTCSTCVQFDPEYTSHYEGNIKFYEITCGYRNTCEYIYDEIVTRLEKQLMYGEGEEEQLEEELNGEFEEEKER